MRRRAAAVAMALVLVIGLVALLAPAAPAPVGDGFRAYAQDCRTETDTYSPGKTVEGFRARATDGCNVYEWTGSIAQGPSSGTVTFTTTDKVNPWEGGLPNEPGVDGYNKMRAAQEANMRWIYGFKTGPGVRVTVTYNAD